MSLTSPPHLPLPVLIVDDDKEWLTNLCFLFDYYCGVTHCIPCSDSRDVLNILETTKIGAILLDLHMPYLSGKELLEMISSRFSEIPVIIFSGYIGSKSESDCRRIGAKQCFCKTTEPMVIIEELHRLLTDERIPSR